MSSCRQYIFGGKTGYLIDPRFTGAEHKLVAVRHSAAVEPWSDKHLHKHHESEELYLLLSGQLDLLIDGKSWTLRPMEMLMVRPSISHGVIGGSGPIEHFIFRAPAIDDREILQVMPGSSTGIDMSDHRGVNEEWGFRASIDARHNQNCWLVGKGTARFWSTQFLFAYLNYPTDEEANEGIGTRHRLHLHRSSWEYYVVLEGLKTLQVESETVSIERGQMLEVPPGVKHTMVGRKAPYRGFTFRVPILSDKEIF